MRQLIAFAFGVPHDINGFHPYTVRSFSLSHTLVLPFPRQLQSWALKFNLGLTKPPTDPLRPVNSDNAWGTRLTAAAGTSLAAPYSYSTLKNCSHRKDLYTPKGVFGHAASLDHAFAHCRRFLTAASRRSPDSISVPMLGAVLSHPLTVIALVGHYPTNKLIVRRPLNERIAALPLDYSRGPSGISPAFAELSPSRRYVPTCY